LRILGYNDIDLDHVSNHIGKSFGLLTLLRGTLNHAIHKTTYLPASLCLKHNVTEEDIYQGKDTINLE
jgi:NADH dehydrogenase [ubiquinone] 1 alpha subcomplex assembly factor 6